LILRYSSHREADVTMVIEPYLLSQKLYMTICIQIRAETAQSIERLRYGLDGRGSIPGGGKISLF
jgi:hypothetical protein